MVCKYCGAIIDDDAMFCGSCGNRVEMPQVPQPPQAAPTQSVFQPQVAEQNDAQAEQSVAQHENPVQEVPQQVQQQAPVNQQYANYQPAPTQKNSKGKMKPGIIIGIVAGVLAVIAIVMVIVLFSIGNDEPAPVEPATTQAVAQTDEDVKAFFNELMATHNGDSFPFVYCASVEDIKSQKMGYLCDDIGTFYSWTAYTAQLTNGTLKVCDIMTQEEYDKIITSGVYTWTVFKSADAQAKLDGIFGKGKYKISDIINTTSMVTASGYLVYAEEPVDATNTYYYGKILTCQPSGTDFVVEAYVIKCDNSSQNIYDEATGTSVGLGTITPGTGVTFDSIVQGIDINTALMSKLTFTFGTTADGVYLKSVQKPAVNANAGGVSKGTTQAPTPQINGEVVRLNDPYYRYVKAGGGLNMRSLPSVYSSKVTSNTIPNGACVEVIGYSPYYSAWVYVTYSGFSGWVNSNYLVSTYQSYNSYSMEGYYTVRAQGGLNIRNTAGGSKIGNIPNGATVYVYYCNDAGTWAYVSYGGTYGWVSTSYLY